MDQYDEISRLLAGYAPTMPEEYDNPTMPIAPHARAFGAGVVDPARIPSNLYDLLFRSPHSDWYRRRMQELHEESPIASAMGSAILPGLGAGRILGGTAREIAAIQPGLTGLGGSIGLLWEQIKDIMGKHPERKRRPQSAYPTGGAY